MTSLKPSEVLAKAADLIEPEGAWTQGALARDANAIDTEFGDDPGEPICWCAIGAIGAICALTDLDGARLLRERVEALIEVPTTGCGGTYPLAFWNDAPDRTQAEVVAALRKASELAKAEGQ